MTICPQVTSHSGRPTLLVILASGVFSILAGCGTNPHIQQGQQWECKNRIVKAIRALHDHVRNTGDLPRDAVGRFSPSMLICDDGTSPPHSACISRSDSACTLLPASGDAWGGLVWSTHLNKDDLSSDESVIVVSHHWRHLHEVSGRHYTLLGMAHGPVISLQVDPALYRSWQESHFEERLCILDGNNQPEWSIDETGFSIMIRGLEVSQKGDSSENEELEE